MNRRKSREQAFILLFESSFNLQEIDKIVKEAECARGEKLDDFSKVLLYGTIENTENIDKYIDGNLNGWQKSRLSYVVISMSTLPAFSVCCYVSMFYVKVLPSLSCRTFV